MNSLNNLMKPIDFCDLFYINTMGIKLDKKKLRHKAKVLETSHHYNGWLPSGDWFKKEKFKPNLFRKCRTFEDQLAYLKDLREEFDYIAMDTQEIYHLDIDIHDDEEHKIPSEWWDLINDLKQRTSYYCSTTKKNGLHIFFRSSDWKRPPQHDGTLYNKLITKYDLKPDELGQSQIELLCGQWGWCPKDNKIVNNGIVNLDKEFIESLLKDKDKVENYTQNTTKISSKVIEKKPVESKKIEIAEDDLNREQKKLLALGHIIKIKYIDNYDDWIKIVWSLMNDINNNYTIAKSLSSRSNKFDLKAFNSLWDGGKTGNSIGTFYYYAKISNEQKFYKIIADYWSDFEFLDNDDSLATFYIDSNKYNHFYKKGDLYTYYNNKWNKEEQGRNWIKITIPEEIKKFAGQLVTRISNEKKKVSCGTDEWEKEKFNKLVEKEKKVNKLLARINATGKINSVVERTINYIATTDYDDIEFETKFNYFAFKNVLFDLEIGQQIEARREDYILLNTGYNWREPSEEEMEKVREIWGQIFPDKEVGDLYKHLLANGMVGQNTEKLGLATGGGRNGKGLINEFFGAAIGYYFYTCDSGILLKSKPEGASPTIAEMGYKRLVVFREPEREFQQQEVKINTSLVKELTGGETINGRMLYSNNNYVELKAMWILEGNELPLLSGNINQAEIQRFIAIPFVNTFTEDQNDLKLPGYYPLNKEYKTKAFKRKYRYAFIKFIMDYMREFKQTTGRNVWDQIPIPDKIKAITMGYLEKSDEIKCWLKEILQTCDISNNKTSKEIMENNLYITTKDIFQTLKCSDLYSNFHKEEKRKFNDQYFKTYLQKTRPYSLKYYERFGGKYNILTGYKLVSNELTDDEL